MTHLNPSNCKIGNRCMLYGRLSIIVNFQIKFSRDLKIMFQKYHQIVKQFAFRSSLTISSETTTVATCRQRVKISPLYRYRIKRRASIYCSLMLHNTRAESQLEIPLSLSDVSHERSK